MATKKNTDVARGAGRAAIRSPSRVVAPATSDSRIAATAMRALAQQLIAEEFRTIKSPATKGRAAFHVCEKLRQPLGKLVGVVGYRSLLSRALSLARAEVPALDGLQINPDGSLAVSAVFAAQLDREESTSAGSALTAQLLGLLLTFIGEALTLRLVHNIWPNAPLTISEPKGSQS